MFLIYNINTCQIYRDHIKSLGAAKRMLPKIMDKYGPQIAIADETFFRTAIDHEITVKNLTSGQDVKIMASQKGGVCDPSTERYWSM